MLLLQNYKLTKLQLLPPSAPSEQLYKSKPKLFAYCYSFVRKSLLKYQLKHMNYLKTRYLLLIIPKGALYAAVLRYNM